MLFAIFSPLDVANFGACFFDDIVDFVFGWVDDHIVRVEIL